MVHFLTREGPNTLGCSRALYRTEICKETCNRSLPHQVQRHPRDQWEMARGGSQSYGMLQEALFGLLY